MLDNVSDVTSAIAKALQEKGYENMVDGDDLTDEQKIDIQVTTINAGKPFGFETLTTTR